MDFNKMDKEINKRLKEILKLMEKPGLHMICTMIGDKCVTLTYTQDEKDIKEMKKEAEKCQK